MRNKVIFADVDGTLCFHEIKHGVSEIQRNNDGVVLVRENTTGNYHKSYDVSASKYNVYLDIKTRELGHKLRQFYFFIYVTGARQFTVKSRINFLDFADAFIIENGGLILDQNMTIDEEWYAVLEPERKMLKPIRNVLLRQGWNIDDKGRTSALRVRMKDNPRKSDSEFQELYSKLDIPEELKTTSNMDNLDIILRSAGKANGIRFWLNKYGHEDQETLGIGDDINDIDFLQVCDAKYVLSSSFEEVLVIAKHEGWEISKNPTFDGINEIMLKLLALAK